MSQSGNINHIQAQKGQAELVAWTFPNQQTLKPIVSGFKHAALADNQVRVKVLYIGIGEKAINSLKNKQSPSFAGYQAVGVVEAIGSKVGMRKVGDVVGVGSTRNQTSSQIKGFSSHLIVSADWTFPIPKNIPLSETAPLLGPGVRAFKIISSEYERLRYQHNRKLTLGILGVGALGHLTAKFANYFGYEVTIFSQVPDEEKLLRDNGVHFDVFLPLTLQQIGKNTLKFDVVIVATVISKEIGKRSIELARRNGKLVFLTESLNELGITGFSLVSDQKQVTGVSEGTKQNFYKMFEMVSHQIAIGNRNLLPICEHFEFNEIERALERTQSPQVRYQCVIKVGDNIVDRFNKNQV